MAAGAPLPSDARYRGLLEAAPDAILVVDQDGKIVLLNLLAEARFGYAHGELVGRDVQTIIPHGFTERLIADASLTAEETLAQQIGMGIELIALRKHGSEFPIELMLSPLESADGILVTAAIRDITVRKKAEKHVTEMEGRYRGLLECSPDAMVLVNRRAEIVFANVEAEKQFGYSRDELLGQQVTNIIALSLDGKTGEDPIAEARRSDHDPTDQTIRRALELVASHRDGTEFPVEIMLSPLDSADGMQGAIADSHAEVTHDQLPPVFADKAQLTQLLQNLVGNAIKYQGTGIPRVHISALHRNKQCVFSISDSGIGIEPKYFERIFGMFQRLHKRDAFGGTGIGLAICKKIVEQHGGTISVESSPGRGSTFRFGLAEGARTS